MPQLGAALASTFAAIGTAVSSAVAAVSAFAASSVIGSFIVNAALSVGFSLLARALSPKPKIRQSGIQTEVTTTGGTQPQRFILGTYATAGHLVAPPYSHGSSGDTPNAYLNYVIEVSDFPGVALSRVIVNDDYSALDTTPDPDYGDPLLKFRVSSTDYAWIKFYDGTQSTADAMLVAKYASHPDRPWTSNAIGTDTAYVVMTFLYNRELFNNLPSVRFEITGIPLYDPRKDTTAGGSGSHRFNDQSTWEFSDNPAVMIYNIMRGIVLPDGSIYGGETAAADLPYSNWAAAMNVCDAAIGTRKTYRAGLEVDVTTSPADVIDELLKVCHGQISEYGGVFRIRCGPPGASVLSITDDSIIITDDQEFTPFPGLEQTYNAISGSYPEPNSLWQAREAPPIYNATWETEDSGRRLPIEMTFPACPYIQQVEQLMNGYIEDNRRFRTHRIVLPPNAAILEPLDTISWTSARNGYTTKLFEVIELVDRPMTMLQEIYVRERDASDYNWTSGQDPAQPSANTGLTPPGAQLVQGLTVTALTLKDGLGLDRRPAIRIAWTGTAALDAEFVQIEIRLKVSAAVVFYGVFSAREGFAVVSDGILPSTVYEVRIRYVMDRPADWSSWVEVTTGAIFITDADFENGIKTLFQDAGLSAPEIVSSLPMTGNFQGRLVFLTTDNKLYRWTGTAWTAAVPTTDLTGTIIETQIANDSISTPKIKANAVTATQILGATITGDKIVANTITGGLLATSGIITQVAQIGDALITNAKIQNAAVDYLKIASRTVTLPVQATGGVLFGSGSAQLACSASITLPEAQPIIIWWSFSHNYTNQPEFWGVYITLNGSIIFDRGGTSGGTRMQATVDFPGSSIEATGSIGTNTVNLYWNATPGLDTISSRLIISGFVR